MRRLILMLWLPLIAFFGISLTIIRAQRADTDLLHVFLSEGCPSGVVACWNGITPGQTTFSEALALLQADPWVTALSTEQTVNATNLSWRWTDAAPLFLRAADSADNPPELWEFQGTVTLITLPTDLTYGAIEHALGTPVGGVFQVFRSNRPRTATPTLRESRTSSAYFLAAYDSSQVVFETHFVCPTPAILFWDARVTLSVFADTLMQGVPFDRYDIARWLYDAPCP